MKYNVVRFIFPRQLKHKTRMHKGLCSKHRILFYRLGSQRNFWWIFIVNNWASHARYKGDLVNQLKPGLTQNSKQIFLPNEHSMNRGFLLWRMFHVQKGANWNSGFIFLPWFCGVSSFHAPGSRELYVVHIYRKRLICSVIHNAFLRPLPRQSSPGTKTLRQS